MNLFEKNKAHGQGRKWRAHQGRNWFFCDGRLVMASQGSLFLLTFIVIFCTSALFSVFDLPFLCQKVSPAIPVVSVALFLLVMSSLLKTALSDPGIIPRADLPELESDLKGQHFDGTEPIEPITRTILVEKQPITLKYCFTCCMFRPPRASHCSDCNNCVLTFDHHCPWVGNCIGQRNRRHFYLFIVGLSLLDAFMGFCVGLHLYMLSQEKHTFLGAIEESPMSVLIGLINVTSVWPFLWLSASQTHLLALGQTTNEQIKETYIEDPNPYNTGNCLKNVGIALCSSEMPSLLNRREWLAPSEGPSIFVKRSAPGQHHPSLQGGQNEGGGPAAGSSSEINSDG